MARKTSRSSRKSAAGARSTTKSSRSTATTASTRKSTGKTTSKRSGKKRTTTKKKTTTRRKTTTKKKSSGTARKKKKKTAATGKKKTAKKTTTGKSKPDRKKTTKKKSAPAKTASKKTGKKKKTTAVADNSKAPATTRKKSKKRSGRGRALGARSVAEAASAAEADAQGYVFVNGRRVRMISTGGQGVARRSRPTPAAAAEDMASRPAKPVKTKLTTKELRHYRGLLLEKRAELIGDVTAMESAALQTHGGNLSNLPIHMADIGSDTYDQDFMLGLAETERKQLVEIDEALMRIADRTYGVCQMTGNPIPKARLDAKPWAKYTIEAARMLEGQWRR